MLKQEMKYDIGVRENGDPDWKEGLLEDEEDDGVDPDNNGQFIN